MRSVGMKLVYDWHMINWPGVTASTHSHKQNKAKDSNKMKNKIKKIWKIKFEQQKAKYCLQHN